MVVCGIPYPLVVPAHDAGLPRTLVSRYLSHFHALDLVLLVLHGLDDYYYWYVTNKRDINFKIVFCPYTACLMIIDHVLISITLSEYILYCGEGCGKL